MTSVTPIEIRRRPMAEAIPPAFTSAIGRNLMAALAVSGRVSA